VLEKKKEAENEIEMLRHTLRIKIEEKGWT
jgi:hypothetical protein